MADLIDQTLDLLSKYEVQRRNVRNDQYSETSHPPRTAQGLYQITNQNWRNYGPKVGIDVKKYPNAMSVGAEDQKKVARHLLTQTPLGVKNWMAASNPKFLDEMDAIMAQGSKTGSQENEYDKYSLDQLKQLKARTEKELANQQNTRTDTGLGDVKAPLGEGGGIGGSLNRWVQSGFGIGPAVGDVSKAFSDPDWRDKASDVLEGGGKLGPLLGIGSLIGAGATGGLAALPEAAISLAGAYGGSYAAQWLADKAGGYANLDPKTRRLVDNLAGLGGGIAGYKGGVPATKLGVRGAYNAGTSPIVGAGVAGGLAHELNIPGLPSVLAGYLGRNIFPKAVDAITPEFLKDWAGINKPKTTPTPSAGPSATKAAPTGTVKPPKPTTLPRTPEMDDAVHFGNVDEAGFKAHMKGLGMTDDEAQIKWQNAQSRSTRLVKEETDKILKEGQAQQEKAARKAERDRAAADKAAKEKADAENQGPTVRQVETLKDMMKTGQLPSEDFRQQMSRWLDPGEIQHHIQTALGERFGPGPQARVQPPVIPAESIPVQQGGAPQGLVQSPQGGFSQPMGAGSTAGEPSGLTQFKVSSGPRGETFGPKQQTPTEIFKSHVDSIVEAYTKAKKPPVRNVTAAGKFLKDKGLDFDPHIEELRAARKIYDDRTGPTKRARDRMP